MGLELATIDEIAAIRADVFGDAPIAAAVIGDCAFHAPWRSGDNRQDLARFAADLGLARAETIDLYGSPTIRADLHAAPAAELAAAFDLVIDAGTMFCCFDVARVWQTLLELLAPGGVMIHVAGLTGYMGRSYYSFHPALFRDFYRCNGFELLQLAVRSPRHGRARWWQRRAPAGWRRIAPDDVFLVGEDLRFAAKLTSEAAIVPNDATIFCAARRVAERPFTRALPAYYG